MKFRPLKSVHCLYITVIVGYIPIAFHKRHGVSHYFLQGRGSVFFLKFFELSEYNFVSPLRTLLPIYRVGIPLPSKCCILYIFFSTNISTEYFKHAAHSPFFSSKWRLFHNPTFFGSCIIHILHTECAKI